MEIRVVRSDLGRPRADVAACFAYEGDREPRGVEDRELRHALAREMHAARFQGVPSDLMRWNASGSGPRHLLVVGLGREGSEVEALRNGCARAARAAVRLSAESLRIRLPRPADAADASDEVRAAVEGALLGAYHFERHLSDESRRLTRLRALEVAVESTGPALLRSARLGEVAARAVCATRDLVNEGPSRKSPEALAQSARRIARTSGLVCRVYGPGELRRMRFHALLAVARGSDRPARVVHLRYRPRGKPRARVVLVGKGVTFDSGGLNLKPSDSMLTMKMDMAGAAAVLSAMSTLGRIGCRAEVHGLLGLVENMGGGDAYKPGDILDSYSGKTIEVMNTDAEGRLVLCDLLAYAADRLAPSAIVDVATLTGACVVALGTEAAGLFTRDDALAAAILDAGARAGEKLWRLPLYDEYLRALQRGPADLRSMGERWGGAITAALFLGEFVPRDVPWLHLDIAGPAFAEHERPETREGGTGAATATLVRWLESL
jgi:leucyl aminopeptidase